MTVHKIRLAAGLQSNPLGCLQHTQWPLFEFREMDMGSEDTGKGRAREG